MVYYFIYFFIHLFLIDKYTAIKMFILMIQNNYCKKYSERFEDLNLTRLYGSINIFCNGISVIIKYGFIIHIVRI